MRVFGVTFVVEDCDGLQHRHTMAVVANDVEDAVMNLGQFVARGGEDLVGTEQVLCLGELAFCTADCTRKEDQS